MFSGILFEEITPEYYNARGSARISLRCSALIPTNGAQWSSFRSTWRKPKMAVPVGADLRNENWTVQTSFTGPSTVLGATNLRREA